MARKGCPLPPGTIGTPEAARVTGLAYRSLIRWVERGVLAPELVHGAAGSHFSTYAWRLPDLVAARMLGRLRDDGVSAQRIQRAAEALRRFGEDFSSAVLVADARDVYRVLPGSKLLGLVEKSGQISAAFALGELQRDTESRFARALRARKRTA